MEERLQILRMVQEGKVTPEEGVRLLEALEASPAGGEARTLRVRVLDPGGQRRQAEVRVPLGLVRLLTRVAEPLLKVSGQNLDLAALEQAIRAGQAGRILEVETATQRVEIDLE